MDVDDLLRYKSEHDVVIVWTQAWGEYLKLADVAIKSIMPSIDKIESEGEKVKILIMKEKDNYSAMLNTAYENMDANFFFMPPDTIFSEDSLYNLWSTYKGEPVHVAIPHLRINREKQSEIKLPCGHWELIKQAWPHLHYTAINSKKQQPNVWHKGIYLRDNSMDHHIPTIYYCKFDNEDLAYFNSVRELPYVWDNQWTAYCYERRKLRIVGAAKMACCFETTEEMNNRPRLQENPDIAFCKRLEHNRACGSFTYVY